MSAQLLAIQARVIAALIYRETRVRFGGTRLGYLWALIEPILHVAVLSTIYVVWGRQSPLGNLQMFFITGIMPFFLFSHTSSRLARAITSNTQLLRLPAITNMDVIFAKALLQGLTWIAVFGILLFLAMLGDKLILPENLETCAAAAFFTFMLGFGVGLINSVLNMMFKSWEHLYSAVTRPLYLLSGVFYLVDALPDKARAVLVYNPMVHAIEWFREGYFANFSSLTLDRSYLIEWAIASTVLGLCLERAMRRRLHTR
ncbi:ABC transporter permease [Bordetella pseudohinzii]|uniref:Transport permease protein n=1 Tax=Bordetella pseudohinzii TaxID=1331258 RepID=A0A0J6F4P8_9BORD|nr:ABC transporter permease [Bordetella pseudohinzii]ANY16292.1 polyhydroxyalkanoate biosynthesis repressor PhaR [Bordetella pseudohinzii]KMM27415.1 polyhydroxyalkanoate synthesis repressor PhaR [Bordetella pseudohinzii]KXA78488.1 polyhydroxyalkanoate biosynthesis repressor PhaR [Bordetella pseudohinzii]KXA80608.1 polyhydroxyalkanoate biosynthesis repressor PhaR [Bordetella pseudohinzii]CUI40632.1 Polysialic acid transport protein kpsM [Bordetella pseudohinzii]